MDSTRALDGERRVTADQWDIDGWHMLASEADKATFEIAKPVYERLVTQFPPIGKFWKSYAEHLAREEPDDSEAVIAIYDRAVKAAPTSIELWRSYVSFSTALAVKVPGSKLESDALNVHERALAAAGLDLNAHPLWSHYIDFLKKHSTLSDSQRRDALRRLYQRAVRNPMQNLDNLWREYSTFEQTSNNNKEFARNVIAENQPKNIDARAEFRARRTRREGLTLSTLPVPPRGRAKESSQAQQWRRFIAFERSNPFSLAEADLKDRVVHAFESALGPMYRYPDFWIDYLSYMHGSFATALQQPSQKASDKDSSGTSTESSAVKKMAAALEPLIERGVIALPSNVALHVHASWLYARFEATGKAVSVLETLCRIHPSPLAYVHLMRATRKYVGREAARKVFGKARKDEKGQDPCVYIAAAQIEFAFKENKVAKNVFEFGLKNFAKSAVIAGEYVKWLWGIGDFEYARVVLKKVMPAAKGTPDEVRLLWEKWLELEELIGDTASVDKVEAMWKESGVGRTGGVIQDVMRRTRFLTFEGLSEDEMAAINIHTGSSDASTGPTGAGGGRRDPRTGRRVASSSGSKDGARGGSGQRQGADSTSQGSVLKVATDWLHRMASGMQAIAAPPPLPEVLFRMIMDTPESFADTPAGTNSGATARRGKETVTGKKRKGEEIAAPVSVGNMTTGGPTPPQQDVFRARQAAKQSRMR